MAIEKRFNKVWNGTEWIEVYSPTSADLVKLSDNTTVEATIATIKTSITDAVATLETAIDAVADDLSTHEADTSLHKTASDISKLGNLAADANTTYATKAELAGVKTNYVVADIDARDALDLAADRDGDTCWVVDATDDPTVTTGAALYVWDGADWVKVAEAESLDVAVTWDNVGGRPTSSVAAIDDAVTKAHTHTNKTLLDLLGVEDGELTYDGVKVDTDTDSGNRVYLSSTEPSDPNVGDIWLQPVI